MLKIIRNDHEIGYKAFNFPSGEVGFKLDLETNKTAYFAKTLQFSYAAVQTIVARLNNSNDIMELLMAVDALRRLDDTPINLFLLKIPYAQQDRVCVKGESFSLKVFANLINSLNFNKVTVVDPHSQVSEAVFDRLEVISQLDVINKWPELISAMMGSLLVAPDAGSNKKVSEIAKFLSHTSFIRCDKLRNLSTGEIVETIVYADDLKGKDVFILDDICLGGRTFTELAKALKKKNCGKINLFVTHGVFSAGTKTLFENGIDVVWTTNSWSTNINKDLAENIKVLNLENKLYPVAFPSSSPLKEFYQNATRL